jgi:hypothetical protein
VQQLGVAAALWHSSGRLSQCAPAEPRLDDGVVTYSDARGERRMIDVGRRCADLWVAPDESVIAFIAIDASDDTGPDPIGDGLPFILASSIYVARRADGFAPVRVHQDPVLIYGRTWTVFRAPRVSQDLGTVYFSVPTSITSGTLLSVQVSTGQDTTLGPATSYCVAWGGRGEGAARAPSCCSGGTSPTL